MKGVLFERIQAAGQLPTPPGVVVRLLELTRNPEVSAKEIADTVAMDPGLSAKILRFVNSPLAGLKRQVTSISQAVALMGVRGVKMMALSFAVLNKTDRHFCKRFDYDRYVTHAFACAVAAQQLAAETAACPPQEAFVGGLLSQIGRCVLASALQNEYEQVLSRAQKVPLDLPRLERELLGQDYPSIGGELLCMWGLPDSLCQAVSRFRDPQPGENSGFERVLQTAEVIASVICPAQASQGVDVATGLLAADKLLGIPSERTAAIIAEVAKSLDEARHILELPSGKTRALEELEAELHERITELSLAMHLENQSLAQQQEDLLKRATTDGLTGVGNRAAFDARLALELERSARANVPLGLLMIDVDRFKAINDTYGHLAGDQVLKALARTIDDNIRKIDYCARFGGEEFAVIAPSTPVEGVALVAERLRKNVEALAIPWDGKSIHATISIGVGFLDAVEDLRLASRELIQLADKQLYAAKCSGRNRVCFSKDPLPV